MLIEITLKDPDCLYEPIEEAVRADVATIPALDKEERENLVEGRCDMLRSEMVRRWFEYGEYCTVVVDTDTWTATVKART